MVAVVAARNEAGRVGTTVRAIRALPGVDQVVVADGSSEDGTADEARSAGARVFRGPRTGGKGGALEAAFSRLEPAEVFLLLDADLGSTASRAQALVQEVVSGRADLAIGVLPRQSAHGGFRLVKRTAALAIRALCGFRAAEPLSGQRALSARALEAVRPLAEGFGVEVAMTVDAVRAGLRVREIPVAMSHAATGRDLGGFIHRARQGLDLLRASASRALGRR